MATLLFKLFFLLVIGLCLISHSKQVEANYEASLGRYGADCSGRGICSFTQASDNYNSRLSYSSSDTVLKVQLFNSKFSKEALNQQLGVPTLGPATTFAMDADYPLPQWLKEELLIPVRLRLIPKGSFPASVGDDHTIVYFKLK